VHRRIFLLKFKRSIVMRILALVLALAIAAPLAAHADNNVAKSQPASSAPGYIQNQNNLLAPY
jgi:hypothetical protein